MAKRNRSVLLIIICFICLIILFASCSAAKDPAQAKRDGALSVPGSFVETEKEILIGGILELDHAVLRNKVLVNSNDYVPSLTMLKDNLFYLVGLKETDTQKEIIYIETVDHDFKTSEGVHVGMTYNELRALESRPPVKIPGWGFSVPLASGWNAVFTSGPGLTDADPTGESPVRWLYRNRP